MRRRRGIWLVGLPAAALGAAAVGVHAGSAAPARVTTGVRTIDKTYSCRVRRQHYVDLAASVTLPPVDNQPQPGVLVVTTAQKTIKKNNAVVTVAQVSLTAAKNSLRIDQSVCRRVKQQIPLKPKGLAGPPTTATPTFGEPDNERCTTTARVLVRLRVKTRAHTPTHALLAIRNDNARRQPIAFYDWSPRKFTVYSGKTCASPS
jgi:hypothetical protein